MSEKIYNAPALTANNLPEGSSLQIMFELLGQRVGAELVEFGCATGYFANALTENGYRVTGVELSPTAAMEAERYCEKVLVADLDFTAPTALFPEARFDGAIFGDVLEHVRDPWQVLASTRAILKPGGCVVASIPNIAHGAVRLALLQGRFDYMPLGLLDNTHLRFFTRTTVHELFTRAGFRVESMQCTQYPVFAGQMVPTVKSADFSPEILTALAQDPDIETLQFVVKAVPVANVIIFPNWRQTEAVLYEDLCAALKLAEPADQIYIEAILLTPDQAEAVRYSLLLETGLDADRVVMVDFNWENLRQSLCGRIPMPREDAQKGALLPAASWIN